MTACGPAIVVNGGPSDPAHHEDALSMVRERTSIIGYEFGTCESDFDCEPRGCNGAMCSPDIRAAVCIDDAVAACLRQVGPSACGCVDGVCRWSRTPPVLACSMITLPENQNRPFEGGEDGMYPRRHR